MDVKFKIEKENLNYYVITFPNPSYTLFNIEDMSSYWNGFKYSRIIGILLNLGAIVKDGNLDFCGSYRFNNLKFKFRLYHHHITCSLKFATDIPANSKIFNIFFSDLQKYIFYNQSLEYNLKIGNIKRKWSHTHDIFDSYISNIDYYQPYDYYYLPSDIISYQYNEDHDDLEIFVNYLENQLSDVNEIKIFDNYNLYNIIYDKFEEFNDLLVFNNRMTLWSYLGNYNGSLFVIYSYENDNNIYLRVKAENIQSLINFIQNIIIKSKHVK